LQLLTAFLSILVGFINPIIATFAVLAIRLGGADPDPFIGASERARRQDILEKTLTKPPALY
jgi:hypothetical protein